MKPFLLTRIFPPPMLGSMRFGDCVRFLGASGWRIDAPYWMRAVCALLFSALTSSAAARDRIVWSRRVREHRYEPPIFVLGHWRSGTSHLHNLFMTDKRLSAPTTFEVFCPHLFLSPGPVAPLLFKVLMPESRPMDMVSMNPEAAQEDEFALATTTGLSPYLAWLFPDRQDHFSRYLTFESVDPDEIDRWKEGFDLMLRRFSLRHDGRPLVLKSPTHTARVALLLDLFPDARFVHIHRHPLDVFRSMMHTLRSLAPWMLMQRADPDDYVDDVIATYRHMHEAYLAQRQRVPEGRLFEIGYEQLCQDRVTAMERIYDALGLPAFAATRADLEAYVGSIASYTRNAFDQPDADLRDRLATEWGEIAAALGYAL